MSGPLGSQQWMYATGEQAFYPYQIDNSLRFDGAGNLYRQPTQTSDQYKWTFSAWVKRSKLNTVGDALTNQFLIFGGNMVYPNFIQTRIGFADDLLTVLRYNNGTFYENRKTNRVFRDLSGWYHIVWTLNSVAGVAVEQRSRVYVNGEEIPYSDWTVATAPVDQSPSYFNSSSYNMRVGCAEAGGTAYQIFNGYMSEINFVDGQALSPTSFGEFKSGIWVPKDYTGSYGTNGFHLDFADSSDLGNDAAGSNNFTPSGIATSDQMLDSPTNNFATLNPLWPYGVQPLEGNLALTTLQTMSASTFGIPSSGKWYVEARMVGSTMLGLVVNGVYPGIYPGNNNGFAIHPGAIYENGSSTSIDTGSWVGSSASIYVVGILFDMTNLKMFFHVAGTWRQYGDPDSSGAGYSFPQTIAGQDVSVITRAAYSSTGGGPLYINFGQDATFSGLTSPGTLYSDSNGFGEFMYPVPTDALALCTQNLPDPTFDPEQGTSPLDAFNSVLYDGNGTDARAITGVGFSPDFTWIKARGPNTRNHRLTDTVRGATRSLATDTDNAEIVDSTHLQSFDADGFTLGTQDSFNASGESYVAWNWKLGGSSNTFNVDGIGYATASAAGLDGGTRNPTGATVNTEAGIGIYTYTGDGTVKTIAHGLGVTPKFVIIKNRTTETTNWRSYTNAVDGSTESVDLNLTNAFVSSSRALTSTTFDHGSGAAQGANGDNYVAWVFAEKEGFSKFGAYAGNGSTDGPFIYTGFKPAFVLIKEAVGAGGDWAMYDSARNPYNVADEKLRANTNGAETVNAADALDFTSNGMKLRNNGSAFNASGDTYFYMAFAEQPFKFANAR